MRHKKVWAAAYCTRVHAGLRAILIQDFILGHKSGRGPHTESCKMHAMCDDEFIMQPSSSSKRLRSLSQDVSIKYWHTPAGTAKCTNISFSALFCSWTAVPFEAKYCLVGLTFANGSEIFYPYVSQIERFYGLLAGKSQECERVREQNVLRVGVNTK